MASIKIPYLISRRVAGRLLWYWQPGQRLRAAGHHSIPLGADQLAAEAEARRINAGLAAESQASAAIRGRPQGPAAGTVAWAVAAFRRHEDFRSLKPKTQMDYGAHLDNLIAWAGDKPLPALTNRAIEARYRALRERTAARANAWLRVLRLFLAFAGRQGYVAGNPARLVRLKGTPPRLLVWTAAEIEAAVAAADRLGRPSIGDAILIAADTGQRQGDILALTWLQLQASLDGSQHLHIRQGKRGALVRVPLTPRLAARLAAARTHAAGSPHIVRSEETGRAYGGDNFRSWFDQVRAAAGEDPATRFAGDRAGRAERPTFQDLRDTAVTRLAEAGCTVPEIAAITGHAVASAAQVLKHYLPQTSPQARAAIEKLVAYEQHNRDGNGEKLELTQRN